MRDRSYLVDLIARFIGLVSIELPDDVSSKIDEFMELETAGPQKMIYEAIRENQKLAKAERRPCCQDTGILSFFIRAGSSFPYLGEMKAILEEAIDVATRTIPLRHNTVSIFDGKNYGNNLGEGMPEVLWEIEGYGDEVEITVYLQGGGSSLPGRAHTFIPSDGYQGIIRFLFDTVIERGINACPPLFIGIGIAGTADRASLLSKKALLRMLDEPNPNPVASKLERIIEEALNEIGIGPQGIGGKRSVLGVKVEVASRHPSTLACGVSFGCFSHRRGIMRIDKDLNYYLVSHKGRTL